MTENMQADDVQSRKAFFVRCCLKFMTYCDSAENIPIDENAVNSRIEKWNEPKEYKAIWSPTGNLDIAFRWNYINDQYFMTEGCFTADENTINFFGIPMIYREESTVSAK